MLIKDLQLKGRVLVTFAWDEQKATAMARSTKSVMKPELRAQAQDLKVQDLSAVADTEKDPGVKVDLSKRDPSSEDGSQAKSKVPKWLKGFGKK